MPIIIFLVTEYSNAGQQAEILTAERLLAQRPNLPDEEIYPWKNIAVCAHYALAHWTVKRRD